MKLLVDQDLVFANAFPTELTEDEFRGECAYYEELQEIARRFAVSTSFAVTKAGVTVVVRAQKITLDEVSMNTLFADFLTELFVLETRYSALGGAGCDFALTVVNAVPRS